MGIGRQTYIPWSYIKDDRDYNYPTSGNVITFVEDTVVTLRSEDTDGSENVAEKVNSRSFNLYRDYSKSLTLLNVGEPS